MAKKEKMGAKGKHRKDVSHGKEKYREEKLDEETQEEHRGKNRKEKGCGVGKSSAPGQLKKGSDEKSAKQFAPGRVKKR